MAWEDIARPHLRVLLNDIDSTSYTDDTLDKLLVVSASMIVMDIHFSTTYTVDLSDSSVSPDPSSDTEFINFAILKAACLKGGWDFNSRLAVDGVKAKLGPMNVDVGAAGTQALLALLNDGPCKTYDRLMLQYNAGRTNAIRSILTPFSHEDLDLY